MQRAPLAYGRDLLQLHLHVRIAVAVALTPCGGDAPAQEAIALQVAHHRAGQPTDHPLQPLLIEREPQVSRRHSCYLRPSTSTVAATISSASGFSAIATTPSSHEAPTRPVLRAT